MFQGENEVDTIQRVKNCRIDVDIRTVNTDVDEELDIILKKGLARDPKKRYRTAADFEKDLRRYMSRRHPDFTPDDLGKFLKETMESRRNESAAEIKRTLTETNLRPGRKSKTSQLAASPMEASDAPPISLAGKPAPSSAPRSLAAGQINVAGGGGNFGSPAARPIQLKQPGQRPRTAAPVMLRQSVRPGASIGKTMLLTVLVAVIALFGGKVAMNFTAQGNKPAQFTLRTQPSRVRVMIDNKPINHGRYLHASSKSPLRVSLAPGEHVLLVTRQGYSPVRYEFTLEEGEKETKDDIVLKEKSPLAALKIRMKSTDKGAKLDIDNGYFIAKFAAGQTTAVAPDVLQDKKYKMTVQPEDDKEFVCHFQAHSLSWRTPTELIIDLRARKCTVTGS